jgi:sugar (pentulose or hexulose) kinase
LTQFLVVDFGTTRVKSAIADLETGQISHIASQPACSTPAIEHDNGEIPIRQFQDQFASLCRDYYIEQGISFTGIMLSCQMHGFSVLTADYKPASGYITWKDERSGIPIAGITSWDLFNQNFGADFRSVTGMNPRRGFPVFNVLHMARQGALPKDALVVSLAEILCLVSNDYTGLIHPTMLAGLGIYDIEKQAIATDFLQFIADETGCAIRCSSSADETKCGGYWHSPVGGKIPIYVGVGDHQCTVLGAGNIPGETLSINLGTGSQVAAIDFPHAAAGQVEQRPYFGESGLTTITHIPAGRALSEYIGFLEDVAKVAGNPGDVFWTLLAKTEAKAALESELEFDLGIFSSCWRYSGGGGIKNINESKFTLTNYFSGLLGSFCRQYQDAAQSIDPSGALTSCILSGGIPQKLPQLAEILSVRLGREVVRTEAIDEALIGLRTLALVASGRSADYKQASNVFSVKEPD